MVCFMNIINGIFCFIFNDIKQRTEVFLSHSVFTELPLTENRNAALALRFLPPYDWRHLACLKWIFNLMVTSHLYHPPPQGHKSQLSLLCQVEVAIITDFGGCHHKGDNPQTPFTLFLLCQPFSPVANITAEHRCIKGSLFNNSS